MAAFRKNDPRPGAGSDEETVRVAEKAIQEGFSKKKGVYKSLSAARLLGKVKPSTAYGWLKKGYIDPGEGGCAHLIRTKKRNRKGSVENSNGQLRRFFRRGAYIDDVSGAFVAECTVTISGEPIKSLSGSTPAEAVKEAFGEELFEKLIDAVRKLKA